jgi:thioester reductase-like protein
MATVGSQTRSPTKKRPRAPRGAPSPSYEHVFLTGFPGFIGKRLALRILSEYKKAHLSVLVQEKFVDEARAWLNTIPGGEKRARILVGDVAKMDLGLSGPEVKHLIETVSHVFHLAAVQFLGVDESEAERVNVTGTRNTLAIAREMKKLERFAFFSTCFVSGDRSGVITEDELDEGQGFRNVYERTKYRAEKLVRSRIDELPITIFRPSIVVGHSQTGEIDRFDGVYGMGILLVASPIAVPLPLPGDGTAPLNVVPVDFVTQAALTLSLHTEARGLTFHLVDPNPLSVRHVYRLIAARAGKNLPRVHLSYGITRRLLRLPIIERFSRTPAQALDYLNQIAIYNCANTLRLLEGTGILCPRIDTYVDRLMDYVGSVMKERQRPLMLAPRTDPFAR